MGIFAEGFAQVTHVALGFFYRASIPTDIIQYAPNPSSWGLPSAELVSTGCNLTKYFTEHQIVFGTSHFIFSRVSVFKIFLIRYYNMWFVYNILVEWFSVLMAYDPTR